MAQRTLAGIRVLDFTTYIAGPYGAALLGDLGADVIKVETPDGDPLRGYPSTLPAGESRAFVGVNRNKRGVVLDLKQAADRDACHRLVAQADVVLHNFRPGVAERLALDYDTLVALQPRLVYCSFTGYGPDGPQARRPGFDQVLQCRTGIARAQGHPGDPRIVWGSAVDFYGASLIALGISAALFERERTGRAQRVDTSLLQAALAMQAGRLVWADGEDRDVERDLRAGTLSGIHPTGDGWLYLQAQTQPFWEALCELIGLPELARDPRFADMRLRKANEADLVPRVRAALGRRSAREWEAAFGDRVPCTVVRQVEDVFDDEQVAHQRLLVDHAHPTLGAYRAVAEPIRFNGERAPRPERRAPMLGEHTAQVLGRDTQA